MADTENPELEHFQEAKEELNKKENIEQNDIFDKILYQLGEMGRYQKLLFVALAPFCVFFASVYFVQMFIAATPQRHWCRVPELQHLDMELRRNLTAPVRGEEWDRCLMYNANWSQVLETMQPPAPDTPTVPCQNGWEFELVDIPYNTVISERGWVCEYSGYGPAAQAIFFVGSFVGGLFFGWLADKYGRIPALVGSNMISCIGGITSVYTTGFWDFAFCRFLVGTAYDSCFMMMYILILEYVGPRHRTLVGNMTIGIYFGFGACMLPWLALWIGDWRKLLWVTSLPLSIVLIAPLLVPESARWLSSRGRIHQALNVLRKFEKVNGTKIPQDMINEFILTYRRRNKTDESILSVFKSPPLRTAMIFMVLVYMSCCVIFDGLVRMSGGLGLDFFVTFTLASFTDIPAIIILALVLDRWGRRLLCFVPLILSGTLTILAASRSKGIAQVSLAIMARFFINMSFTTAIQWNAELLPTGIRATGISLIHVSGYIATFLSPFIVYSERLWSSLPLVIIGVIAFVAAFISALLPETKGRPMPQTIADGEKFVRESSLCGYGK